MNQEQSADELRTLAFYATPPTPCSYLAGQRSVNLFADPRARMNNEVYSALADYGFRRSGQHVYRPRCPACDACIPVRIPVARFTPNRSQKRTWARNWDVTITRVPAEFSEEHFDLYRRYISSRHPGGGMDDHKPESYMAFVASSWAQTFLYEFRRDGRLMAVAVVDHLLQGLSAVYTYFDPAEERRGLGVLAVLWEIEQARRLALPYLYLGYWIADCAKMNYKRAFRPLESYRNGRWEAMA